MQAPSMSVILAWPTPNYIDPVTRGNENVVLNIVLYVFLTLFGALRLVTRTSIKGSFGADDALMIVAMVCYHAGWFS
jgi:hypothetical protein